MLRKSKFLLLTLVLVLALAPAAFAGLLAVSPNFNAPDTSNGYPLWYTDANGVTLDLPFPFQPTAGTGLTAPTLIYGPLGPQSNAVAQLAGFDTEAFFFNARPDPKGFQTSAGRIQCTLGIEASYVNGIPTVGQQMVFSRIRIKAPVKVAGTYTFTHPWGTETINVTPADITGTNKGIFYTKDVGLTPGWVASGASWIQVQPPLGYYGVLQPDNSMSTFLRATTVAAGVDPLRWIGDGVTLSKVTGASYKDPATLLPFNKVRLSGPDTNLDGKGHNFVETDLFVVSGHIPANLTAPLPLSVDRSTCAHLGVAEYINLFLTTKAGATITVTDPVNPAVPVYIGTVTDTNGKFYASFPSALKNITVTASLAGFTPTSKNVPVVDYINITLAAYSELGLTTTPTPIPAGNFMITATSSDWVSGGVNPTLSVTNINGATPALPLTMNQPVDAAGTYTLGPIPLTGVLPPSISVSSTVGGSDTTPTAIVP